MNKSVGMKFFITVLLSTLSFFSLAEEVVRAPVDWQLSFQEPGNEVMRRFVVFHDQLLYVVFGISGLILVLLFYVIIRYRKSVNPKPQKFSHNLFLEIVWTAIPVIICIAITIPSMKTLYFADKIDKTDMTVKIIGHQWYWNYAYDGVRFDSYLVADKDLKPGQLRLYAVDNELVLPTETKIKLLITGGDVLHAFGVPSLGVKKDAVPGRTNETWLEIDKPGKYYGHCYEICGINHGYMPVVIKALSKEDYKLWLDNAKTKFAYKD